MTFDEWMLANEYTADNATTRKLLEQRYQQSLNCGVVVLGAHEQSRLAAMMSRTVSNARDIGMVAPVVEREKASAEARALFSDDD